MSAIRGNLVNRYEKLSSEGFKLIGYFFFKLEELLNFRNE